MIAANLIVLATIAPVFAARREGDAPPQGRVAWTLAVAYWLFTIVVAFEMAAGGLWDLLKSGAGAAWARISAIHHISGTSSGHGKFRVRLRC